jgi:hypothetical protein
MTTFLSEHFTLEEAIASQEASRKGIDNYPTSPMVITTASKTAVKLEKVRITLGGNPISINSWIRCLDLNRALGSKDSSQHILGEAVDFICPKFGTPLEICKKLVENLVLINFDQLILEHTWVHISWNSVPNAKQKNQVLSLLSDGSYSIGLTNPKGIKYV